MNYPRFSSRVSILFRLVAIFFLALAGTATLKAQNPMTNGFIYEGDISTAGNSQSWTFSATNGEALVVRVGTINGTNGFQPEITLYNPNLTVQAQSSGGVAAEIAVTATNYGTYTVVVSGVSGVGTCTYLLVLAQPGTPALIAPSQEGGPLTNGSTFNGSIPVGGLDVWTFSVTNGQNIVVSMGRTTNTENLTPYLRLYNPGGVLLTSSFGGTAAEVSAQATNTGTFTVIAGDATSGFAGSGPYELSLAQTGPQVVISPGQTGGPLTNGSTFSGTIGLGLLNVWTFSATNGQNIVVSMGRTTNTENLTPYLRLYDPSGNELASSFNGTAAEVSVQATNTGTFTVIAGDASAGVAGSGPYEFSLAQTGPAVVISPGQTGGPLTNGSTFTGTIGLGLLNEWTFSATNGQNIVVSMGRTTNTENLTPYLRLYDPSGNELASSFNGTAAEVSVQATNTGTFTVIAGDASAGVAGSGPYELSLGQTGPQVVISPGQTGGPLVNGSLFSGTIGLGLLNVWTFSASSGNNIVVSMGRTTNTENLTPYLRLYDPSGNELGLSYNGTAAEVSVRATNTGTFTIIAGDASAGVAGSGPYELSLAQTGVPVVISPGQAGGPLTNGSTFTGDIGLGLLNMWTFSATNGNSIVLSMGRTTNTLTPWLRLYDPSGYELTSDFNGTAAEVFVQATNTGTFTVIAGDASSGNGGSGSYQLSLGQTGPPVIISPGQTGGPLTNGSTFTGTIGLGLLNVWTFYATNGNSIIVSMGRTTNTLTPWLRVYDPSGASLGQYSAGSAAQLSVQATNNGIFTLIAGDNSPGYGGSGTYQLELAQTGPPVIISAGQTGGPLTNGSTFTGNIGLGLVNVWTFPATNGNSVVVSMGRTTNTLTPYLRLYDPSGAFLGQYYAGSAAQVSVQATNTGTFTLIAGDATSGFGGSGSYQLSLGQTGPPVIISPGQTGGPLTNGSTFAGNIGLGLINVWTFSLSSSNSIIVAMGRTGSALTPYLRIYGPNGAFLGQDYNGSAAEVYIQATNSGTFTIIAGDASSGFGGSGPYNLTLAGTGSPAVISAGEQGGLLTGTDSYDGNISVGGLDEWTFTACAGTRILMQMSDAATNTTTLTPWIRLYGRNGNQLSSVYGNPAEVNTTAPTNGLYTVVLGDNSSGYGGSGGYVFTVDGLSSGLKLCDPIISGTNMNVSGIGGATNGTYEILTSTSVTNPLALWTPFVTNQFDSYGTFTVSNIFDPDDVQRYFLILEQ